MKIAVRINVKISRAGNSDAACSYLLKSGLASTGSMRGFMSGFMSGFLSGQAHDGSSAKGVSG